MGSVLCPDVLSEGGGMPESMKRAQLWPGISGRPL